MDRVGMRKEAHHVQSIRFKGKWADDLIYAILNEEWPVVHQKGARNAE